MTVARGQAAFHVEDGRLTLEFTSSASVYLDTPDRQPLSASEPHATLRIVSDVSPSGETTLELDADAVDALADALSEATTEDGDA